MKLSSYADRKAVHRWLRGGSATAPKFMKHQGLLTARISTMLQTVSGRMKDIYSKHKDSDPDEMLQGFLNKYGEVIIPMKTNCELPVLTDEDFFDMCQSKPSTKAGGLDLWKYQELEQLPPSGWTPFRLVAMLAEATGSWPKVIRCISVTAIPKNDSPFLDPDNIRAIGVSSAIYSLWSSIRYRHLTPWMNLISPEGVLGGIPGRSADANESEFSQSLHDEAQEKIAISLTGSSVLIWLSLKYPWELLLKLGYPKPSPGLLPASIPNRSNFSKSVVFMGIRFCRAILQSKVVQ